MKLLRVRPDLVDQPRPFMRVEFAQRNLTSSDICDFFNLMEMLSACVLRLTRPVQGFMFKKKSLVTHVKPAQAAINNVAVWQWDDARFTARCRCQRLKPHLPRQDSIRDGWLSCGASESLEPARIYGPAPPNKAGDSKARRLYAVYQRRRNEGNGAVFGATAATCTALRAMTLTQPGLSSGFTQEGGR